MPSRKHSRNGFDYATPQANYPHNSLPYYPSYPGTYPTHAYPVGYSGYMNGFGSGYTHAYGSEGYHHYMRQYDPSYDAFFTDGPSVEDKWRNTYPYVPTSYQASSDGQRTTNRRHLGGESSRPGTREGSRLGGVNDTVEEEEEDSTSQKREQWGSQWEFIFSCVGLSVGIGNLWRFPFLALENGGGAFLLPYLILLIIIGMPMYFMEVSLGQFSQLGPLSVWKLAPIGRGVGFAMCTLSLIVSIYHNVIMGYCLHYIYHSFASVLPWDTCSQPWSDERCFVRTKHSTCDQDNCQPASEQYWERFVLGMTYNGSSNGDSAYEEVSTNALVKFGNIGEIKWDLAVSLLLSWIIVFICLSKGIKTSGKIVYFTAIFPYAILVVLMVRGLLLDGALEGVKDFFSPKWDKLLDINVWRKAAEQIFFSLSVTWGGLIMFGSYNQFRTKVHYHAIIISCLNFIVSIMASVAIFSVLGELRVKLNVESIKKSQSVIILKDLVKQKQGLTFVVYPEAISLLSFPQVWSALFFIMLFTLGLDSQFASLQTVLVGLYDSFPFMRRHKTKVCFLACAACFLLSLPCVSLSGQFVFDLVDTYGCGLGVLCVATFETFVLMWIYGVGRFADDLRFMLNTSVSWFWRACWSITPVLLTAIFVIACFYWSTPTYSGGQVLYWYSEEAHSVGWGLTLLVALQIPLVAFTILGMKAASGRVVDAFKPEADWGPGDPAAVDEWRARQYRKLLRCKRHPYAYYDNYAMQYPYYQYPQQQGTYPM